MSSKNRNKKSMGSQYFCFGMKKLSEIGVGKRAIIKAFEGDDLFIKLMEMGCVPGETVRVDQLAPLGDPICISVAGYSLSLRLNEAENILVEEI